MLLDILVPTTRPSRSRRRRRRTDRRDAQSITGSVGRSRARLKNGQLSSALMLFLRKFIKNRFDCDRSTGNSPARHPTRQPEGLIARKLSFTIILPLPTPPCSNNNQKKNPETLDSNILHFYDTTCPLFCFPLAGIIYTALVVFFPPLHGNLTERAHALGGINDDTAGREAKRARKQRKRRGLPIST